MQEGVTKILHYQKNERIMAAKNEVAAQRGVLMSLFNKPKTDYVSIADPAASWLATHTSHDCDKDDLYKNYKIRLEERERRSR